MTKPPDIAILLTAAGSSRRMRGGDKLLERIGAQSCLRRQAVMSLAVVPRVIVTLPPDRPARLADLAGLPLEIAILPDAAEGMAASIRHGARAAETAPALMVLPADMPDIDAEDLRRLLDAHAKAPRAILRGAAADGTPGHPVVFPRDLFADLADLHGDEGARSVLARHSARIRLVPLPDRHAVTDLDTPEDWACWRAARGI